MKTYTQILPGIKFIGWLYSRNLPFRVDLTAVCGRPVVLMTDVHQIMFTSEPECVCKTERKGVAYQDTVTLKFRSTETLECGTGLALVVTDVEGHSWLIGSREAPGAVLEFDRNSGLPSGDAAGTAYQVTHVAIKSMVPCMI